MFEENNSKKVFLSVLGVAILIVAVVGISYAAFSYTNESSGDNTVQTGTITMSYSEPTAGLTLENELPMETSAGKSRQETFDFTVHTNATGKVAIPYEINIVPTFTVASGDVQPLADNEVMIYLESKAGNAAESAYAQAVAAQTVAELKTTNGASAYASKSGRTNAIKLLDATNDYTSAAGETTTNYRLRMWIASNVDTDKFADAQYKYALKVNVDSAVAPLDVE